MFVLLSYGVSSNQLLQRIDLLKSAVTWDIEAFNVKKKGSKYCAFFWLVFLILMLE